MQSSRVALPIRSAATSKRVRTEASPTGPHAWVKQLPSADVAVDMARKRVSVSHVRAEALTRQVLRQVKHLELTAWNSGPAQYDVRLSVNGWPLRVETTLERVELASGRYKMRLRTPGKVELAETAAGGPRAVMVRMWST